MHVTLDNNTIVGIVFNKNKADPRCADVLHSFGGDKEMAVHAILTYFSGGLNDRDELVVEILDILVSAIEYLKVEYPQLASQIRKTTIDYIKKKHNDQNPQL